MLVGAAVKISLQLHIPQILTRFYQTQQIKRKAHFESPAALFVGVLEYFDCMIDCLNEVRREQRSIRPSLPSSCKHAQRGAALNINIDFLAFPLQKSFHTAVFPHPSIVLCDHAPELGLPHLVP